MHYIGVRGYRAYSTDGPTMLFVVKAASGILDGNKEQIIRTYGIMY